MVSTSCVYALVTFTWLFFRSHDIATTMAYLSGLFAFKGGFEGALIPVAALWAFTLAIDSAGARRRRMHHRDVDTRSPRGLRHGRTVAVLLSGNIGHEAFIYFQF